MSFTYKPVPPRAAPPVDPAAAPTVDGFDFSAMFVLGTDRHVVPAPLDRMIENVLDWEHLPFVHPENFCSSELVEHGPGWYRARFGNPPASAGSFNQVLVVVHPSHRRWLLTLETGPQQGLVVYAEAVEVGAGQITVELTFYTPVAPRNEAVRRALLHVYKRKLHLLYVQDIAMMVDRQGALTRLATDFSDVAPGGSLGPVDEVVRSAPFLIAIRGQRFWIRLRAGELSAVAADCPHMRGPLPCPAPDADTVTCPWHAYRFDVHTGRSDDGRSLRLATAPRLVVARGEVWLEADGA